MLQVRHGDTIYTRPLAFNDRRLWEGPGRSQGLSWRELADAVAPRPLIAIPHAVLHLPRHHEEDDDWAEADPDDLYTGR